MFLLCNELMTLPVSLPMHACLIERNVVAYFVGAINLKIIQLNIDSFIYLYLLHLNINIVWKASCTTLNQ